MFSQDNDIRSQVEIQACERAGLARTAAFIRTQQAYIAELQEALRNYAFPGPYEGQPTPQEMQRQARDALRYVSPLVNWRRNLHS